METKPAVSSAIRAVLRELGLTVVAKPENPAKPKVERNRQHANSRIFELAPCERPVARVAIYHTQRCACCGETETFFAGTYIRTTHSRWTCERTLLASLPWADVAALPLEIDQAHDGPTDIPACFRCAATAQIIDTALAEAHHCAPRQGQLFS